VNESESLITITIFRRSSSHNQHHWYSNCRHNPSAAEPSLCDTPFLAAAATLAA
jgi:hypothetical protein